MCIRDSATGLVDVPQIFEFLMLAQLVIGCGVGARLAQVEFADLLVYLKDAAINTSIIIALYFGAAVVIAILLGVTILEVWLAFVPGGLYEVTLLSVIFGFNIAFIAFHHTIRIIIIFVTMPPIAIYLKGKGNQSCQD